MSATQTLPTKIALVKYGIGAASWADLHSSSFFALDQMLDIPARTFLLSPE
tara:strand:- start:3656 stop:3808 length:153 start_codon:yes stop_codon:yes gene_type:complete